MHTAYLLVGGNQGNRADSLQQARAWIEMDAGKIVGQSGIYETAAWGNTNQPAFLNQVLAIETDMEASELMATVLAIEIKMGRVREQRYGPRTIDIDILLFDEEIHHLPELSIPHPELANRRFALIPLAEIAGGLVHPVSGKTIEQMLSDCTDHLAVQKI